MSAIPELDDLIREHETFRRNRKWDKQERFMYRMICAVLCAAMSWPLVVAFSLWGLAAIPFAWKAAEYMIPKPTKRDPFTRYHSK